MLILGLVAAVALGAYGLWDVIAGGPLRAEARASEISGTLDHQLREGVTLAGVQYVEVTVADPSVEQRIAWLLQSAPTYAVTVALLALLLRIVWLARRNDPFTLATVRRLRVLAVVALAGGWLAFMVEAIAAMHLSSRVLANGIAVSGRLLHWFLVGFGLLAVAEVVKRGCAMRDELDTVV